MFDETLKQANLEAFFLGYEPVRYLLRWVNWSKSDIDLSHDNMADSITSRFLYLEDVVLVWKQDLPRVVDEFLGLLELGIKGGLFPEASQEYAIWAEAASHINRQERIKLESYQMPGLVAQFVERKGLAPTEHPRDVSPDRSYELFEHIRNILHYLSAADGVLAQQLCLGRELRWLNRDEDALARNGVVRIEDVISVLATVARHPADEGQDSSMGLRERLSARDCLRVAESFLCLQDVLSLTIDLAKSQTASEMQSSALLQGVVFSDKLELVREKTRTFLQTLSRSSTVQRTEPTEFGEG